MLYLLDVGSNVLLDVVLLEGLGSALHGILLHVLRHVSVLHDSLAVRHGGVCTCGGGKGEGGENARPWEEKKNGTCTKGEMSAEGTTKPNRAAHIVADTTPHPPNCTATHLSTMSGNGVK